MILFDILDPMTEPVFLPATGNREWLLQLLRFIERQQQPRAENWKGICDRCSLTVERQEGGRTFSCCRLDYLFNGLIQESGPGTGGTQWSGIQLLEAEAERLSRRPFNFRITVIGLIGGSLAYGWILRVPMPVLGSAMSPIKWGALAGIVARWEIKPFGRRAEPPRVHKLVVPLAALLYTIKARSGLFGVNSLVGFIGFGGVWFAESQLQAAPRNLMRTALLGEPEGERRDLIARPKYRNYDQMVMRLREQGKDFSDALYDLLHPSSSPPIGFRTLDQLHDEARRLVEGAPLLRATYGWPNDVFEAEVLPICRRILALKEAIETGSCGAEGMPAPSRQQLREGWRAYQQFGRAEQKDWEAMKKMAHDVLNVKDESQNQPAKGQASSQKSQKKRVASASASSRSNQTKAKSQGSTLAPKPPESKQESKQVIEAARRLVQVHKDDPNSLPGLKDMRHLGYRILRLRGQVQEQKDELAPTTPNRRRPAPDEKLEERSILKKDKQKLKALEESALIYDTAAGREETCRDKLSVVSNGVIPISSELQARAKTITAQILAMRGALLVQSQAWESAVAQIAPSNYLAPTLSREQAVAIVDTLRQALGTADLPQVQGLDYALQQQALRDAIPAAVTIGEDAGEVKSRVLHAHGFFQDAQEQLIQQCINPYILVDPETNECKGKFLYYLERAKQIKSSFEAVMDGRYKKEFSRSEINSQEVATVLRELLQAAETIRTVAPPLPALDELKQLLAGQQAVANELAAAERDLEQRVRQDWVDPFHFELAVILAAYHSHSNVADLGWEAIAARYGELSKGKEEPRDFVDAVFKKAGIPRDRFRDDRFLRKENSRRAKDYHRELFHDMAVRDSQQGNAYQVLMCDLYLFCKQYNADFKLRPPTMRPVRGDFESEEFFAL
jgi:hypothetical protein